MVLDSFWEGRKLLADTVGTELSAADLETLRLQRPSFEYLGDGNRWNSHSLHQ